MPVDKAVTAMHSVTIIDQVGINDESVSAWLQYIEPTVHEATLRSHAYRVRRLTDFLTELGKGPISADRSDIVRFFEDDLGDDGLALSTLKGYKSTLTRYYKFVETDTEFDSPERLSDQINESIAVDELADPVAAQGERTPLNQEQCQDILLAAHRRSPRHAATVLLLLITGMRRQEAAAFTSSWLDVRNNRVQIPASTETMRSGTTRQRSIPLSPRMTDVLTAYFERMPEECFGVAPETVYHRVKTVGDDAGLRVTPTRLRRTFADRMGRAELPLEARAQLLGLATGRLPSSRHYFVPDEDMIESDDEWEFYEDLEFDYVFDD